MEENKNEANAESQTIENEVEATTEMSADAEVNEKNMDDISRELAEQKDK